jgi:twitching motility protein PilJ
MVTSGIRQMAQSAGLSAQAALQTLESAQLGRQAVAQTLVGMGNIRNEMQAIAENITALARRSAEIENITKVLEDFASQTNLLALNASFEAAGAGAAGRRFAIVADEIRKLAEESARETSRVNHLVQQVQSEIARVVERVQEGVREVETGYNVATSAGGRLEEIAQLAAQSAGLAQEISGLAQSQVSVVERVDQAVQKIAHTAQQTGRESQEGRQSAEAMRALAQALSQNLARFRLPS